MYLAAGFVLARDAPYDWRGESHRHPRRFGCQGSIDLSFPLHVECADQRGLYDEEGRQQIAAEIEAWSEELREL
jgi:hypothetical protein